MTVTGLAISGPVPPPLQSTPLVPNASTQGAGPSFGDILDAVNPLQHIPIVSTLFRAATGSQISSGSQIAGDTLYGTLLPGGALAGFITSAADVALKAFSGKNIGEFAVGSMVTGSASTNAAAVKNANNFPETTASIADPPSMPLANHLMSTSNAQYQRAQAFDAINDKLVKMAI